MKAFLAFIYITLYVTLDLCYAALPSSIKTCPRTHQNPEKCIINAIELVRPLLAKGDLGDGYIVPPIEPLALGNLKMDSGPELRAYFTDLKVNGGSNFHIEKLRADLNQLNFNVTIFLPKLDFTGRYQLNMRLLLLIIKGNGKMQGVLENVRGVVQMKGAIVEKNQKQYVKFVSMPIRVQIGSSKLRLENLFNGDKTLEEVGNRIINENDQLLLDQIRPGLESGLSQKFLEVANKILATATYDEMFPPN